MPERSRSLDDYSDHELLDVVETAEVLKCSKDTVYEMARRGQLLLRRDSIVSFLGDSEILLASGDRITADIVIFATGWRQSLPFSPSGHRRSSPVRLVSYCFSFGP